MIVIDISCGIVKSYNMNDIIWNFGLMKKDEMVVSKCVVLLVML